MQPILNALPKSVIWLMWTLVIIYLLTAFGPIELQNSLLQMLAFLPVRYTFTISWQDLSFAYFIAPVGYAFLHASLAHILTNLAMFLPFGAVVARKVGDKLFLLLFFLGAFAGAMCFYYFHPTSMVPLVGSSGAISALVGFVVSACILRERFPPPFHIPRNALVFITIWFIFNILIPYASMPYVSWEAHLGGFTLGFMLSPILLRIHKGA